LPVHFCITGRSGRARVQKRPLWVRFCIMDAAGALLMQKCTLAAHPPSQLPYPAAVDVRSN
jgi:hypothetical protein